MPRLITVILSIAAVAIWTLFSSGLILFPREGDQSVGMLDQSILLLVNLGLMSAAAAVVAGGVWLYVTALARLGSFGPLSRASAGFKLFLLALLIAPVAGWLRLLNFFQVEVSRMVHLDFMFLLSAMDGLFAFLERTTFATLAALAISALLAHVGIRMGRLAFRQAALALMLAWLFFPLGAGLLFWRVGTDAAFRENMMLASTNATSRIVIARLLRALDRDNDNHLGLFNSDCDEQNGDIHLGRPEIPQNGIDDNCLAGDYVPQAPPMPMKNAEPFSPSRPAPDAPVNVVLLVLDAVRADRVGGAGYARALTPNFDRVAARGVRFSDVLSQGGNTMMSFKSLLSARYRFEADDPPLLETFSKNGYIGKAFVPFTVLDQDMHIRGVTTQNPICTQYHECAYRVSSEKIADLAVDFVRDAPQPFVMLANFGDAHLVYLPHDEFDFGDTPPDLYDGEVAFADRQMGRVLDAIEARGIAGRTLVAVFADHGECMDDCRPNGSGYLHGEGVSPNEMQVPLALVGPGLPSGRTLDTPVELIDLLPTVFDLTGLVPEPALQGRSLVPLIADAESTWPYRYRLTRARAYIYYDYVGFYSDTHFMEFNRQTNRMRLFSREDGSLKHDLSKSEPERFKRMREALILHIEALGL